MDVSSCGCMLNHLSKSDLDLLHNGKPCSQLKVDMRYMPVSKPIPRDDGTIEPAAESSKYICDIMKCHNNC